MELNLKNPIIFFDLETTGVNVAKDRIVEISLIKILPNGKEDQITKRINPEMPIPAEATEIHGITDADVADAILFKDFAKILAKYMEGCDIAGYNSNRFDVPLLAEEFLRVGVDFDMKKRKFIDVQVIFHKMEQRTLIAAYKFFCNKELENAHSAQADTLATYEVLKAQIEKYDEIENDIDFLSNFSMQSKNVDFAGYIAYNKDEQATINFGKHKGKLVEDVLKTDSGYYGWIMKSDFPLYTKKILTAIKLGTFNKEE